MHDRSYFNLNNESRWMKVCSRYKFTRVIAALLIFFLSSFLVAAQDQPRRPEENAEDQSAPIKVDTDLVLIDVKVMSRDGQTVTGLQAEDFAIYEDSVAQQIALFSATNVPLSLALVIDTSGSTQADIGLMRDAAQRFLDELSPQDRVAVIAFSQESELLADLTTDRRRAKRALSELQPGSGTALYDALMLTVREALSRAEGRKAVVMLTDGVDSYGRYTYAQVLPELERAKTTLYFLEVNTQEFTEERLVLDCLDDRHFKLSRKQLKKYAERYESDDILWWRFQNYCELSSARRRQISQGLYRLAHEELGEMAARTGGRVYPVKELQRLDQVYKQIAAELRTQYAIGYYSTNEKRDGKWRTLRVEVRRRGLQARAKPGYRAPLNK